MSPRRSRSGLALLAVAAVMAVLLVAGFLVVFFIQNPPHVTSIVLVVLDTVRADHCSACGYGKPTTPRLERLAAQGLLFDHARSVAPWTLPSHASLFTGRLPHQHGCNWEHRWLADSQETIAETLADAGFETFGVSTNPNVSSLYHLDQGFTRFLETWRLRQDEERRGLSDSSIANAEIRAWLSQRDAREPFFLFVNYNDAHLPYAPPPPNDRLFGDAGDSTDAARPFAARGDLLQVTLAGEATVRPEDMAGLAALYDGDVRTADERLGELVDMLDEFELAEDTVLIVTSDHGEHLGEGGRVDHQLSLDEALLRVPLVVRFPRQIRPARVLEPVALTEVKRWIDELADGRVPGFSLPPDLAPTLFMAEYLRPVDLVEFVRERGGDAAAIDRRLAAAFSFGDDGGNGGWKLLLTEPDLERYSRVDAAGIEVPVADPDAGIARRLRAYMAEQFAIEPFVESDADLAPEAGVSEDELAELRRIGYVAGAPAGNAGIHASEHWSAGMRAIDRKEFDVARTELDRALQLAPNEPRIQLARRHVERTTGR